MQAALELFEKSLARVRELHGIYEAFSNQVTSAVDLSDMLRAEVVLAVSAMDHFIHELTRLGMRLSWSGARPKTDAFNRYSLPISAMTGLADPNSAEAILDAEIRLKHGFLSFQHPDRIAEAIRLISTIVLWDEVGKELGRSPKELKTSLTLIVDRRHKIAHEADIDPTYPDLRWPIDATLVLKMIDEIEIVGRAIFKVVST